MDELDPDERIHAAYHQWLSLLSGDVCRNAKVPNNFRE
jgi:hypothetical protein